MNEIPFAPNGWDEILPGLFMGGHDRAGVPGGVAEPVVVDREFDLVVSLYHEPGHGPADDIEHRRLRIPDGYLLDDDATAAGRLADRAVEVLNQGNRVLCRCQAGYNRSGLVVGLILRRLGYTADEAVDLIQDRRSPYALFNTHFVAHIRAVDLPPRRVWRRRAKGWVKPATAVDIARPGPFGNPFAVGKTTPANRSGGFGGIHVFDAAHAVDLHRQLLRQSPARVAEIREQLAGKNLMCWCKPSTPCHGDTYLAVAAGEEP